MSNATRKQVTRTQVEIKKDKDGNLRIYKSKNQKEGSLTVELVQKVTTKSFYKAKQYNDNLQDCLVPEEEFDSPEKEYENTETRVAWVQVPSKFSREQIISFVEKIAVSACICRVLSYHPILTEGQKKAIASVDLDFTLDDVAVTQVVRNPQGEIALHDGNIQYKKNLFFKTFQEDKDLRNVDNVYACEVLMAEVEGALAFDDFQSI